MTLSVRFPHQDPVHTCPLPTCPAHLILLDFTTRTILGKQYRSVSSSLCNFLHSPLTSSLLAPSTLLNNLFSNTLSLRSSLNVSDQVSHPCPLQYLRNYIWISHWQEDITFVSKITFPCVHEYIPTGRTNVDRPPPPLPPQIDGKTNTHAGRTRPERLTLCCGWRQWNSRLCSLVKPFKSAFPLGHASKKNPQHTWQPLRRNTWDEWLKKKPSRRNEDTRKIRKDKYVG